MNNVKTLLVTKEKGWEKTVLYGAKQPPEWLSLIKGQIILEKINIVVLARWVEHSFWNWREAENRRKVANKWSSSLLSEEQGGGSVGSDGVPWSDRLDQPNKRLLHLQGRAVSAILPNRLIIQLNRKTQIQLSLSSI